MRYFEIVKPTTMHILSDTDLKEPTWGKPRIDGMKSAGNCQTGTATLPDRKTYLIGSHVGSIYRPGVRNSAGEFSSSQVTAANPFFKGPTDDCRCLLPLFI